MVYLVSFVVVSWTRVSLGSQTVLFLFTSRVFVSKSVVQQVVEQQFIFRVVKEDRALLCLVDA